MAGFTSRVISRTLLHECVIYKGRDIAFNGRTGAFPFGCKVDLKMKLPTETREAVICFLDVDDNTEHIFKMQNEGSDFVLHVPMEKLAHQDSTALLVYKCVFETPNGSFEIIGKGDGLSDIVRDKTDTYKNAFRFLIYIEREIKPDWFYGGVMYQIFPDRFCRGREEPVREDAVLNKDWYEGIPPYVSRHGQHLENNVFFGGDLYGVIDKLDYLKSLGITCIYLNPIFEAYSNHKYDTGDYNNVDKMFGGNEAFEKLISACKKRDIRIILDGVFNHTGNDSVYFDAKGRYGGHGAYTDPDSKYREWYNFTSYPDKYESWWGIGILPRVMSDTPSYREFLFGKNGVVRKYIKLGISGWRLDVADELSDDFLKNLKTTVLEENSKGLVIGEVWENAVTKESYGVRRKYFRGYELDSVMNYPMRKAIIAYVKNRDYLSFLKTSVDIYESYPTYISNMLMNIVGTHDTERICTALAAEDEKKLSKDEQAVYVMPPETKEKGIKMSELAYVISYMLPGVPCLYYGDETGMEGYSDPFNRRPYPWGRENQDMIKFFKKLGEIRKNHNVFKQGNYRIVHIDKDILCIERKNKKETIISIVNVSDEEYKVNFDKPQKELLTEEKMDTGVIQPLSARIYSVSSDAFYSVNKCIKIDH
ncbi:MAG: glycoside hydrolase family 13 protein [Clostridiales bacterium]|nr:glycoside hydrolase family 13 protein [Clostridiales bacterium]